ncbi:MAG: alpha/beta hydrolase [Fermentimonas sp.]|jgi:acetyl esterase/lipase
MMKKCILLILFIGFTTTGFSQFTKYERHRTRADISYKTLSDIPYYSEDVMKEDSYIREKCLLDIYYPETEKGFATVVWFHGGGLQGGDKTEEYPHLLKESGICIVNANYRMYPKAKCPDYLEDAAAAIAWTFRNIEKYGGDTALIFISGHSAGGYLTSMVGMDKKWLAAQNIDANKIAGLIPMSGHTITHFKIREEKNIGYGQPVIDEYAPLYHVRADAPPLLLITGDRELDMSGRYEENAYMARMMKYNGHEKTYLFELQGFNHEMEEPASFALLEFIYKICQEKKK